MPRTFFRLDSGNRNEYPYHETVQIGYQAFLDGEEIGDSPYYIGTKKDTDWRIGWMDAARAAQQTPQEEIR